MNQPKQQIITREEADHTPATVSETAAILQLIERAASNPNVDIEKMRQLMDMRISMEQRAAERAFDRAMSEAQSAMRPVEANAKNPQTRSKYATYDALNEAIREIYTEHGFSLSFNTADGAAADHVRVICRCAHNEGHRQSYQIDMPADGKGAKGGDVMTKTHATGSAISYGKRYLLTMVFNLSINKDDDGNRAGQPSGPISAEQAQNIRTIAEEVGADLAKFCAYMKVESVPEIPASEYSRAVEALKAKRKAKIA